MLREVIAETLERIGDDEDPRLRLVTITGIKCNNELTDAVVYYSTLEDEAKVATALNAVRHRLQKAIAGQMRARRTPTLTFEADTGVLSGRSIEALLAQHPGRDVAIDATLYRDPEAERASLEAARESASPVAADDVEDADA